LSLGQRCVGGCWCTSFKADSAVGGCREFTIYFGDVVMHCRYKAIRGVAVKLVDCVGCGHGFSLVKD